MCLTVHVCANVCAMCMHVGQEQLPVSCTALCPASFNKASFPTPQLVPRGCASWSLTFLENHFIHWAAPPHHSVAWSGQRNCWVAAPKQPGTIWRPVLVLSDTGRPMDAQSPPTPGHSPSFWGCRDRRVGGWWEVCPPCETQQKVDEGTGE